MVFRSSRPWSRKGRSLILLLLIVLLSICAAPLPMTAAAMPMAARGAYEIAPDPPVSSATAILTPQSELSSTAIPGVPASSTASSSVTPTPTLEPTHTPQLEASAEPTDSSMPTGTPTSGSPPVQPSPVATAQSRATTAIPSEATTAVVVAQALHLREGPGARYPIRAIYGQGTVVGVLGRDRTGQWLRVVTPDERAGWMALSAVDLRVPLANLLIVDGALPPDGVSNAGLPSNQGDEPPGSWSRAPADSGIAASAADVSSITDAPKGLAIVAVEQTILHIAPGTRSEGFQSLRRDEQVKLLGQARGAWVRVQAFTSVVPGWVYAADLRPLPGVIEGGPVITTTATLSTTATMLSTVGPDGTITAPTPSPTPTPAPAVVEAVPDPDVVETAVPPPPHVPVEITVEVVEATAALPSRPGGPTATPATRVGIAGMRVQIVTVFGDILVEAVTPANGRVTFTHDVPADTALFVQIPALGLRTQLPPENVASGNAQLTIAIPP